ncbi:MAG: aspartate/glutamate racemase family protein [Deltaproteobacteria bacterium]|nr:aspartate/glutamate racemase family protein [Deltaproteobacteria bacterium]
MKTIGLLGGMSWESSSIYYRWINEGIKRRLGGLHSAQIVLVSLDFQEIEDLQHTNKWSESGELLSRAARQVEAAGADFLLICTNTMHKVATQIEEAISIPLIHIADATAEEIKGKGIGTVGLLGTKFTMEQDFYAGRLNDKHGLHVITPSEEDREVVHQVIYKELVLGTIREDSRQKFITIMNKMSEQGAEGIIEGCTEIVMLVQQEHTAIPLFDTTAIHAQKAVEMALS